MGKNKVYNKWGRERKRCCSDGWTIITDTVIIASESIYRKEREREKKHERQDDELYMEGRKRQNDQRTITKLVSGNIVSSVDNNKLLNYS